jgi:hypothetical protein
MLEVLMRFAAGGLIVCAFAAIGDVLKPKSFAGLFGAAPSIALATLTLTIAHDGAQYAAVEARSMIAGALGFLGYSVWVSYAMAHYQFRCYFIALISIPLWFAIAFGTWAMWIGR